jgi:hypothetical protein
VGFGADAARAASNRKTTHSARRSEAKCGGESGIRTFGDSLDSATYRFHNATVAENASVTVAPCTLLHASRAQRSGSPSPIRARTRAADLALIRTESPPRENHLRKRAVANGEIAERGESPRIRKPNEKLFLGARASFRFQNR